MEEFNQLHFPKQLIFHASVGSQRGLAALAEGKAQVAGVHLFHPPTGDYNLPYVEKHLAGKKFVVVNLAYRRQGLLIQTGNPKNILKLKDLSRDDLKFINRNPGSGTRYLLDYLLGKERLAPEVINGYKSEKITHLEIGLEILRGDADAGMGIEYVAHLLNLDFVPLIEERFDLVAMKESFSTPPLSDFFAFLEPERLTLKTATFRGYDFRSCGTILS